MMQRRSKDESDEANEARKERYSARIPKKPPDLTEKLFSKLEESNRAAKSTHRLLIKFVKKGIYAGRILENTEEKEKLVRTMIKQLPRSLGIKYRQGITLDDILDQISRSQTLDDILVRISRNPKRFKASFNYVEACDKVIRIMERFLALEEARKHVFRSEKRHKKRRKFDDEAPKEEKMKEKRVKSVEPKMIVSNGEVTEKNDDCGQVIDEPEMFIGEVATSQKAEQSMNLPTNNPTQQLFKW